MGKRRLDTLLAERGLFPSRTRAAASVMAGEVRVGSGRTPGREAGGDDRRPRSCWRSRERPAFVSRGGIKLANALDADRAGRERAPGARRRRLDRRLHRLPAAARRPRGDRGRRRLRAARLPPARGPARAGAGAHERPRARARDAAALRSTDPIEPPSLAVVDVSFISLAKVLGAVLSLPGAAIRRAGAGQAPVRGRPRAGRQGRGRARPRRTARRARSTSARPRSRSAPPCSATAPRACRARRATRRRSSGWRRARARAVVRDPAELEALAREVEP